MRVGNGSKVNVIAVGTLPLHLPSGLILDLNNCYSVYMNKTFYGYTPNENGLLDLDRGDTHFYNIEAKRCKVNNDSATYLWHCRLGHIGVKRMKKLHVDGFLESLDACGPCHMGKMTKTLFSGTMERATDLLEIIHN